MIPEVAERALQAKFQAAYQTNETLVYVRGNQLVRRNGSDVVVLKELNTHKLVQAAQALEKLTLKRRKNTPATLV